MPNSLPALDLSFEVFPAGSETGRAGLAKAVSTLSALNPRFVSITHGADGSDQNHTLGTIDELRIQNPTLGLAGHLTMRGGSKGEVLATAEDYAAAGARWVVALRGDAADGAGNTFRPHPHGFQSSPELIAGLRERTDLRIAVAGYPEAHPDSRGEQSDLDHLNGALASTRPSCPASCRSPILAAFPGLPPAAAQRSRRALWTGSKRPKNAAHRAIWRWQSVPGSATTCANRAFGPSISTL